MDFDSGFGILYCAQLTASALCRDKVVTSAPTFKEVKTPVYAPGDFEVKATAIDPSSVLLTVSVPEQKNGALDHCYITYYDDDGVHSVSCNDHGGNASTVVIDKLTPETEYTFTATFVNVDGGRELSTRKVISVMTPGAPGDFEVKGIATEPWSALLLVSVPEVKNGALDRCHISYNDRDGRRSFSCNDHEGKQSEVVIDKLKPETDYSFTVTFVNIHGGQEFSTRKEIAITTPAALGDFEVKAITTGPSSALLLLSVPEINNHSLEICYASYVDADGEHRFSCQGRVSKAAVVALDELKPRTGYTFTVTFANTHGRRELSTSKVISFMTPAGEYHE
ncbi:hypothetical protein MTO96_041833 [Rhipicephalus appendiculatus]